MPYSASSMRTIDAFRKAVALFGSRVWIHKEKGVALANPNLPLREQGFDPNLALKIVYRVYPEGANGDVFTSHESWDDAFNQVKEFYSNGNAH